MSLYGWINHFFKSENHFNRLIRAGGILLAGSLTENLFRFIRNIILVRLLVPEVFGLMAMVLASIAVMEAVTEVGLKQSLIRHKKGSEEGFLNIIWWLSLFRGLIIYVIGYLIAPLICDFYQKQELLPLIRIGFISIFLNSVISPKVHVLEKEMSFKGWVFLMQGSGILGVIITVTVAFFYHNVWALVLGYVAESFMKCFLSFIFYPFIPSLFFSKYFLADILTFSKKMFGLPILMMLFVQTDVFVIGRILSMEQLGMYFLAKSLAEMPNTFLSKVVQPIILPTLAQIQDEKIKLKDRMLSLTKWSTVLGLPFVSFLLVFSNPILSVVYGLEYNAVAGPFGLLCFFNFILFSSSFFMNVYIAIGQPDIHRVASLTRTAFFLIIIYPMTKYFGLAGAAISVVVSMCILLMILIIYSKRILNIGYLEYFGAWIDGAKLSLIVIIPGSILNFITAQMHFSVFVAGLILSFIAWGLGILKMVASYKSATGAIH